MPESDFSFFSRPDVLVALTTAPTGFGHLRVTWALKDALPPNIPVQMLGVHDPSFKYLYNLISRYPPLRFLSESVQNISVLDDLYCYLYRNFLKLQDHKTYDIFYQLIKNYPTPPKTVVIVSTHFTLAHQIAFIKTRLETDFHLKIIIAVVVTDDSPQHIWGIPGADFLFVPSLTTKTKLERYLKTITKTPPSVHIIPYPISPKLASPLTPDEINLRRNLSSIKLMIPVSGAAVQLSYLKDLLKILVTDPRFSFTVVSRESSYCNPFLNWCKTFSQIEVLSHPSDEEVVRLYAKAYQDQVYTLEVTKPSEQAFKALLPPNTRGGSILLFSPPVGRQEYDNLKFLHRHKLIYTSTSNPHDCRGLELPSNGQKAGQKILSLLHTDLFFRMLDFTGYLDHPELRTDGPNIFWSTLNSLVTNFNK